MKKIYFKPTTYTVVLNVSDKDLMYGDLANKSNPGQFGQGKEQDLLFDLDDDEELEWDLWEDTGDEDDY